jgi:ankyrin repeat protein
MTTPMFAFASNNNNASVPSVEIDSSTPFIASSNGELALLQQSLSHLSVPATVADSNGLTPLHSAASYNQVHVMRWLFTQNVDINARDSDGDTPLHHCDNVSAARILVEEGKADYRSKNNEGKTALEVKQEEAIEMESGMDEDIDDDEDVKNLDELIGYLKSLP